LLQGEPLPFSQHPHPLPDGSFEPLIIPKHERRFTGFDQKIIAMYARGMSVRERWGRPAGSARAAARAARTGATAATAVAVVDRARGSARRPFG
jgi:hypothetical protein